MLLKIIGVGICTLILNLCLKNQKPEIALLVNVCGSLVIFMLLLDDVSFLIDEFLGLENYVGQIDFVKPILKVLGVGYITEFSSSMAEDVGNKFIASKIVLGGKIAICTLALPVLKKLIQTILSFV